MSKSTPNPKVDGILSRKTQWRDEYAALRTIALECALNEEVKWGWPCYTHDGSNIVLIHGFKDYCALLFFKGALMKDPKHLLIQQTENVQAARQVRFTTVKEITSRLSTLKAYIREAVEVEKAGLKVEPKRTSEFKAPDELKAKFVKSAAFKKAFEALTPGRQRAYLLHFSGAKQSKTRQARIEKCAPQILAGRGLHDE